MTKQTNVAPQIDMVHHVHWDPMWYSSYQEYRIRLYRLVKKLLRILETNPEYGHFMFDGQVGAIEDYLEVTPEDEEKIRRFVRQGRLAIGPWYTQPEEFLVSGESLVRNLQLGMRRATQLGGAMPVSYLCDPVGHVAQLPQILAGFGLKYFCAARGIQDGDKIKNSEFIWEAPDGSEVLAQSLPIGYSHRLPLAQQEFESDLARKAELIGQYNATGTILFTQGADHGEPMEEALALAAEHNRGVGWPQIVITTLEGHMKGVEEHRQRLSRWRGELRHSRNMPMLTGILTTRMEIKRANADVQTGLERWLEPFCAFHSLLGGEYPAPFIDLAWRYQIKNSFHDCIYGAHADHVTPDVMHGYKQAAEIVAWKTNEALHGVALRAGDGTRRRVVLFNPSGLERVNEAADCELFFAEGEAPRRISLRDAAGTPVPFQVNGRKKAVRFAGESGNVTGETAGGQGVMIDVTLVAARIPALGYAVFYLSEEEAEAAATDLSASACACENGFIRVGVNANGTLDVLDKAGGALYEGLHFFEDSGDRGDQYNYSAALPAGQVTSRTLAARVACECLGPAKAEYRVELDFPLPEELDGDGAGRSGKLAVNRIATTVTVRAHSPRVEFHTVVDNHSRDHRLTAAFPTGVRAETVDSGSQFGVNTRPVAQPSAAGWNEKPSGFHPHHRFLHLRGGGRGFAFMDRGLTEHKAGEDGDVFVTLLRCTSHLSKDTLPERNFGHAGPGMPTPLGQEPGLHEYDYAICLGAGRESWEIARQSADFASPVRAVQLMGGQPEESGLPDALGLLRLEGEGVLLSAVKMGEDGSLIVRLYNSRDCAVKAGLVFFRRVQRAFLTDLLERPVMELEPSGRRLALEAGPCKILTVSIMLEG